MTQSWTCPYCSSRRRSERSWRDHLVTNECGHVPDEVQASVCEQLADSFTEAEFVRVIVPRFRGAGWWAFHSERGRGRDGDWFTNTSDAGLPDWLFIKPPRLLFVEFKKQDGKPTSSQVRVIRDLQACDSVGAYFARPADAGRLIQLAKSH